MCDENRNEAPFTEEQNQQMIDNGMIATVNAPHNIHCLSIIGQIEGHFLLPPQTKTTKYEHLIPALAAIEQDSTVEGLMVVLNTVGGDVEAGLAIAEMIAGMSKPSVSIVLGGGHSIGVPLAVSTDVSFIVPSATMTIHPVRTNGMVLGVPQTMTWFQKMQDRITRFVTENSRMKPERFRELLMEKDELVMAGYPTRCSACTPSLKSGSPQKLKSLRSPPQRGRNRTKQKSPPNQKKRKSPERPLRTQSR